MVSRRRLLGVLIVWGCVTLVCLLSYKFKGILEGLHRSTTQEMTTWEPRKVLIFAYGRTGSSLTGDIIHHSSDVYYVYEPLRKLQLVYKQDENETQVNHILRQLFSCHYSTSLMQFLESRNLSPNNYATKDRQRCLRLMRSNVTLPTGCVRTERKLCQGHRTQVIKVIRYSMNMAPQLLTQNPDLGIIFLMRDPRASLWSQIKTFNALKSSTSIAEVTRYCRKFNKDLLTAADIFSRFPKRIRFLRYEDLAKNPVLVSKKIYAYLGLHFTDDVIKRIVNQTGSNDALRAPTSQFNAGRHLSYLRLNFADDVIKRIVNQTGSNDALRAPTSQVNAGRRLASSNFAYSLNRQNSEKTARGWRVTIPWRVVLQTQEQCKHVMEFVGYRAFGSRNNLKNLSLQSWGAFSFAQRLTDSDLGFVFT